MKLTGTQKGLLIFFIGFGLAFALLFIFPGGRSAVKAEATTSAQGFYKVPMGDVEQAIEEEEPVASKGTTYLFRYQDYYLRPVVIDEPGKPSYEFQDRYLVDQIIKIRKFDGNLGSLLREKLTLPDTVSIPDPDYYPVIEFKGLLQVPSY
jgi:hypothetical protein